MFDSIVYTDSLSSYDKLDASGFIHHRINHFKEFADRQNHINGIKNFWNQAKRVLRKYNGIDCKFSLYSWKNANFDLTSACRPGSFKPRGIGVKSRANLV